MGRLENRLRRPEEEDERVGRAAAIQRLADEDLDVLVPYLERWGAAGGEHVPQPRPKPEEQRVLAKPNGLRRRALREGWGDSAYRVYRRPLRGRISIPG